MTKDKSVPPKVTLKSKFDDALHFDGPLSWLNDAGEPVEIPGEGYLIGGLFVPGDLARALFDMVVIEPVLVLTVVRKVMDQDEPRRTFKYKYPDGVVPVAMAGTTCVRVPVKELGPAHIPFDIIEVDNAAESGGTLYPVRFTVLSMTRP